MRIESETTFGGSATYGSSRRIIQPGRTHTIFAAFSNRSAAHSLFGSYREILMSAHGETDVATPEPHRDGARSRSLLARPPGDLRTKASLAGDQGASLL